MSMTTRRRQHSSYRALSSVGSSSPFVLRWGDAVTHSGTQCRASVASQRPRVRHVQACGGSAGCGLRMRSCDQCVSHWPTWRHMQHVRQPAAAITRPSDQAHHHNHLVEKNVQYVTIQVCVTIKRVRVLVFVVLSSHVPSPCRPSPKFLGL
jgi:hypothetical protein